MEQPSKLKNGGKEASVDDAVFDKSTIAEKEYKPSIKPGSVRPWVPIYERPIGNSTISLAERQIDRTIPHTSVYSKASSDKSLENLRLAAGGKLTSLFTGRGREKGKLSASTGSVKIRSSESFSGSKRVRQFFGRKWRKKSERAASNQVNADGAHNVGDVFNKVEHEDAETLRADELTPQDDLGSIDPILRSDSVGRAENKVDQEAHEDAGPSEDQKKLTSFKPSKTPKSKKSEQKSGGIFGLFRRRVQDVMPLPSVIGQRLRKASVSSASSDSTDTNAMKSAFYNVAVFAMAACCIGGAFAAYFLFYEFVKPVLWAVICGIVLYPLKRRVTTAVRSWLDFLSATGTPLTLGVVTLPLNITSKWGEFLLDGITNNLKTVLLMAAAFPTAALLLHFETLPRFLVTTKQMLIFIDQAMNLFKPYWAPVTLLLYMVYICLCNLVGRYRHVLLCHPIVSWSIWIAGLGHVCNYFGPLRTILFSFALLLCATYYLPIFRGIPSPAQILSDRKKRMRMRQSMYAKRKLAKTGRFSGLRVFGRKTQGEKSIDTDGGQIDVVSDQEAMDAAPSQSAAPASCNVAAESNSYLKRLFIASFFVYVSLHLWIILLLVIPIGVALIKRAAVMFQIHSLLLRQWYKLRGLLGNDARLIVPPPLVHFIRVLVHIDRQVIYYLRHSMDFVGSLTAIVMLVVVVATVTGFVFYQLYYESMHLAQLCANIANQTLAQNPTLQKWLRETANVTSVAELVDEAADRGFAAARGWLSHQVHEIMENEPEKAQVLEKEILTAFDALFERWKTRGNQTDASAVANTHQKMAIAHWADAWTTMGEGTGDLHFMDYLQEHFTVALSVADSAWLIIKNNMEVLLLAFTQIGSTLMASGTAVVDFCLDMVVFLTFLLYVLSESEDEYKPLKMLRELVPGGDTATTITEQVEEAVNGVFFATSKIALFYGMLTWLTHTLFAVNLVFIPSVLAATFSAIPFFGAYFVVFPAVLELWLIRGEFFLAVLLFSIHYVPVYVVDDAIYSEITLTTPLLSGMAIAGGILWWGLEGAIFGPLVLCFILVLGGVYKTICFQTLVDSSASSSPASSRKVSTVMNDTPGASSGKQEDEPQNGVVVGL